MVNHLSQYRKSVHRQLCDKYGQFNCAKRNAQDNNGQICSRKIVYNIAMDQEEFEVKRKQSIAAFILGITGIELCLVPFLLIEYAVYFFQEGQMAPRLIVALFVAVIIAIPSVALYLFHQASNIGVRPYTAFNRIAKVLSIISLAVACSGTMILFVVAFLSGSFYG